MVSGQWSGAAQCDRMNSVSQTRSHILMSPFCSANGRCSAKTSFLAQEKLGTPVFLFLWNYRNYPGSFQCWESWNRLGFWTFNKCLFCRSLGRTPLCRKTKVGIKRTNEMLLIPDPDPLVRRVGFCRNQRP